MLGNCLVDRLGCNNVCVRGKWQREILCFRSVLVVLSGEYKVLFIGGINGIVRKPKHTQFWKRAMFKAAN